MFDPLVEVPLGCSTVALKELEHCRSMIFVEGDVHVELRADHHLSQHLRLGLARDYEVSLVEVTVLAGEDASEAADEGGLAGGGGAIQPHTVLLVIYSLKEMVHYSIYGILVKRIVDVLQALLS